MRTQSILFFFAAVLVVGASFFVLVVQDPESMRVTSDDRRVTVVGYARSSLPFLIRNQGAATGVPLRENMYRVEPDGIVLEEPAKIQMSLDGLIAADDVQIYTYDESLAMWHVTKTSNRQDAYIETTSDQLGVFALGDPFTVNAPAFLTSFDALRSKAPVGTVGYQIAAGVRAAQEGSPVIQLTDQTETGGCGGLMRTGEHPEYTESSQEARVMVNDVETDVVFVFRAEWFVDSVGCPQDEPLLPFADVIQ